MYKNTDEAVLSSLDLWMNPVAVLLARWSDRMAIEQTTGRGG